MKRKKKKGRPAKAQIPSFAPRNPIILDSPPITYTRSFRRNPKYFKCPSPEIDDDERKEKKVKLVVRLPPSDDTDQKQPQKKASHSRRGDTSSESESYSQPESDSASDPESKDRDERVKKRKINAVDRGSDGVGSIQEKKENKAAKATDTQQEDGLPLESGPTTPLPDRKLLVFILDRLQKKDTYGVFSEPVDIDELPDYFEVIEQPMDFGTVRKKLVTGAYKKLEELEADVFLICSNAMLYNAADTVYYRQARSIQEIAKRDFENLRHGGNNGEPKIVRRGRPPNSKNQKKSLETSPLDRVHPSPSATLISPGEKGTGSNSYNLRKGPALYRYRSTDLYGSSYRPRNGENYSESMGDWNNEFPASILRADVKHGKKLLTVDENKRNTYMQQFRPQSSNSMGDMRRLMMMGLHEPLVYARSLARFAANLGPVAWKVASKKIEHVIPPGTQYGPGWVAETGSTSRPSTSSSDRRHHHQMSSISPKTPEFTSPATHGLSEEMVEAVRKLNNQNEQSSQGNMSAWKTPVQPNHMHHPQFQRNGFSGIFGGGGTSRQVLPGHQSTATMNPMSRTELLPNFSSVMGHAIQEEARLQEMASTLPYRDADTWTYGKSFWPIVPGQQSRSLAAQQDLNLAGSPGSSLQIGSPQQQQQPDLALQL